MVCGDFRADGGVDGDIGDKVDTKDLDVHLCVSKN